MCHYLVDQITQTAKFADVEAASRLRAERTDLAALLTAQMYSYWYSAPAGPGVYEMLCQWTADQPGVGAASRASERLGRPAGLAGRRRGAGRAHAGGQASHHLGHALHALARNEASQWPRRRKTGSFFLAGEDSSGAALLADEELGVVYRVLGISTSLGDLIRANGNGDQGLVGSRLVLTLLPFMGSIVYDGTLRGAPPTYTSPALLAELSALAASAQADGKVITQLPAVVDAPLLGKRVVIQGLQAKPELNGKRGIAGGFDDSKERYAVALEDGGGSFKLRAANLEEAPKKAWAEGGGSNEDDDEEEEGEGQRTEPLTTPEETTQRRLARLRPIDDFWVFRRGTLGGQPGPHGHDHERKERYGRRDVSVEHLAPTAASTSPRSTGRPMAAAAAVERLASSVRWMSRAPCVASEVARPSGHRAGYYPPPTDEELTAMGVSSRLEHAPLEVSGACPRSSMPHRGDVFSFTVGRREVQRAGDRTESRRANARSFETKSDGAGPPYPTSTKK